MTELVWGGGSGLVARPVFKTAMERSLAAPVGSIPTRSRQAGLTVVLGLLLGSVPAAAQRPAPAAPDSLNPVAKPVKPFAAFAMSLAVPGWGQARLDRKLTGALFITVEGLSAGMTMKTIRELRYLERINDDSARIASKRTQRQDWLILWGFNHLFAGLEAFVATQLHDFPRDVQLRLGPAPGGGVFAQVAVPFQIR